MRILNSDRLTSHGNREGRRIAAEILEDSLQAADPYDNTTHLLRIEGDTLYVGNDLFVPEGSPRKGIDSYRFGESIDRVFVFGAGKGIQRVAQALEDVLGDRLTGGMVLIKHQDIHQLRRIQVRYTSHPVPAQDCVDACREMTQMIGDLDLTERDLVFTIVGNGVASMLTYPSDGIKLEDVMEVTRILQIEKGLTTPKLNIVRNQLDRLKGGRITRLLVPAKMVHLIPIDLNEPNAFGYGGYYGHVHKNFWLHTLPDISTPEMAIKILKENNAWDRVGESIRSYLQHVPQGHEVLTPTEFEKMDARIFGLMPASNSFVDAAMDAARQRGYAPHFLMRRTFVEASAAGTLVSRMAINVAEENEPFRAPCMLLLTGEMVVAVNKHDGIGGRNQEFSLSAASVIQGNKRIVAVAVDTDGTDGPGGAFHPEAIELGCDCLAGGMVDGYTAKEAEQKGINICAALQKHDSSRTLWELDSGVWSIHNISIQDLVFVLIMDHDG